MDEVVRSVEAYSAQADAYEAAYDSKYADIVARFASSLPTPSLILDAGCGPGRDLARFAQHGHIARGLDLNPEFVAKASAHAPTTLCDLRQAADRYPSGMFDAIWAAASLVHLSEAETVDVLSQFASLLRHQGKLFVSLKSSGVTGWLDEPDARRFYTVWRPEVLADAVTNAGFKIDEVIPGPYVEVWATRA